MAHLEVKAGDTEPIDYNFGITSDSELTTSDVSSADLYARNIADGTLHVDGASVTVNSVSASQNSDGTWDNTFDATFDPVGNAADGNDAFGDDEAGNRYEVETRVTWSDSDTSTHPNDSNREWKVKDPVRL